MFLKIKLKNGKYKYLNILHITYVEPLYRNVGDEMGPPEYIPTGDTRIGYTYGNHQCSETTSESVEDVLRRFNKVKAEAKKLISRFELMDL